MKGYIGGRSNGCIYHGIRTRTLTAKRTALQYHSTFKASWREVLRVAVALGVTREIVAVDLAGIVAVLLMVEITTPGGAISSLSTVPGLDDDHLPAAGAVTVPADSVVGIIIVMVVVIVVAVAVVIRIAEPATIPALFTVVECSRRVGSLPVSLLPRHSDSRFFSLTS